VSYRPSAERYAGGGKVKYIVYRSPQPLRNGRVQQRTRVKRLYFPKNAKNISLGKPTTLEKRTGREAYGVAVTYRYQLSAARARRGRTTYELPLRWADREKVVELPRGAKDLRLTDRPPEGPKMAIP
jgi:hypothetical protein